jgi:signal peptidase I
MVLKRTTVALIVLVLIPVMAIAGIAAWRPRETRALAEGLAKGQWLASYGISSGSMRPTLEKGDYVYAITRAFADRVPVRGEIAVYERDDGASYVHRIVGLPGDRIALRNGILHLNGTPLTREYAGRYDAVGGDATLALYRESFPGGISHLIAGEEGNTRYDNFDEIVVPPGYVFLLGDNRDNAADSRYFGAIRVERLRDKPTVIWWSVEPPRIGMSIQ